MKATRDTLEVRQEFEIDASVAYRLGNELISSEVQALIELVKNSYDADASYADIVVETEKETGEESRAFPNSRGYIIVEDDGSGMDWRDIKRGWFTISASAKRDAKARGETTPEKGRTPLGDKGLGRLGTQRLGRYLEMWTARKRSDKGDYVGIDWGEFRDKPLSQVPAYVERDSPQIREGTRLVVSGLWTPELWQGKQQLDLTRELSQLIFPFGETRPFDVFLQINGRRIEFDRITDAILAVADLSVAFESDGQTLGIHVDYRPSFLLAGGQGDDAKQQFERLIAVDQGADYFSFLTQWDPTLVGVVWCQQPGMLISVSQKYDLADLGGLLVDKSQQASVTGSLQIANPGPFQGQLYQFARRGTDLSAVSGVFDRQSTFSRYIGQQAGVRVFRDGFGIRPFGIDGNDWLGLGKRWTSGTSWYGLRPNNVIGYVSLTAKDNAKLEEATDREGFIENAYSKTFNALMRRVVDTVNNLNERLRRGYVEYRKVRAEQEFGLSDRSPAEVFTALRDTASKAHGMSVKVAKAREQVQEAVGDVQRTTSEISNTPLFHSEEELKVAKALDTTTEVLERANAILREIETMLRQVESLGQIADIVEPDLEYLRRELEQFSELAGLGITAEALVHEITIIIDGLASRTSSLVEQLRARNALAGDVLVFTEQVHITVANLRKQISHLDPSLRYVREQRHEIQMLSFFEQIESFYMERFARGQIVTSLQAPFDDFTIRMNRGKLTQVIDNLFLNSEYWLSEDLRLQHIHDAVVYVRSRKPFIEIWDSGRGVAPSIEHTLFRPFITMKPPGQGRGLGLFIARQLLDSSGCSLSLLPDRNEAGRRFIFRLDLTGALDERN